MPYHIGWFIEGRIAYVHMEGVSTPEEAHSFDQEIKKFLDSAQAPLLHMIFDTGGVTHLPNIKTLSRFTWPRHPANGWVASFPKSNQFINLITSIVAQVFKARYRQFDSFEEALAFLQHVDSTLPNLSAVDRPG
jgi:hypothetical protein